MEMPGCCLSTQSRDSPRLVGRACTYTITDIFVRSSLDDGMCITIPLPWLTIDRLRSGRDIRLPTATMRALNSRRPQLTSSFHLYPRFLLCLLFVLFVVHGGRARSVPHDGEGLAQPDKLSAVENQAEVGLTSNKTEDTSASEQVQLEGLAVQKDVVENEKVKPEEPGSAEGKVLQPQVGVQLEGGARSNLEQLVDHPSPEVGSVHLEEPSGEEEDAKKIDVLETPLTEDIKARVDAERDETLNQEDEEASVAKKRRRNDLAAVSGSRVPDAEEVPVEQVQEVNYGGIRRFDVRIDAEDTAPSQENVGDVGGSASGDLKPLVPQSRQIEANPQTKEKGIEIIVYNQEALKPTIEEINIQHDAPQGEVPSGEIPQEEIPDYFRKSAPVEDDHQSKDNEEPDFDEASGIEGDESAKIRGYRYVFDSSSKPRHKSSTVYLNAEEKKAPEGEQQLIVDGQIKKLISIRDDALDAQKSDKLEEAKVLSPKREVGLDEIFTQENDQNEPSSKDATRPPAYGRAQNLHHVRLIPTEAVVYNILQDAVESYPKDETLLSYVDPNNATLKELLTSNQLSILQMAEKLLPLALRPEYSDSMFSCVQRFEYLGCVKYFTWPLIKQYFPSLPAFPDYQTLYPFIDLYPQYPLVPFPSLSGHTGELPEVVDADATRTRRPRPELIIIHALEDALKGQSRLSTSPSYLDPSMDPYIALIPQDQLLTISMAEKLIPVPSRPEFVQKSVNCMIEYSYLSCVKYSIWPTVRLFAPNLPDISSLLSSIWSYIPPLSTFWPSSTTTPAPEQNATTPLPDTMPNSRSGILQSSNELEEKIMSVLLKVWVSKFSEEFFQPPFTAIDNSITFSTFTKRQLGILQLAEGLIPPAARPALITEVLVYLQRSDNFIDVARYVIWPTVTRYISDFPKFSRLDDKKEPIDWADLDSPLETKPIDNLEKIQERINSGGDNDKTSSAPGQDKGLRDEVRQKDPVISVTDTRFVPIYTEHPETVILNILRSVQLQSVNLNTTAVASETKSQQLLDFLSEQQVSIVNLVNGLLPASVRPVYVSKMLECLRINSFLVCTREVTWPTLLQVFPWLPNFPDFGPIVNPASDTTRSLPNQNITEPSPNSDSRPLSETNVKTGLHGDTTVTVTDTRFFPIYNDLPETVIQNILKAVQLSILNLPDSSVPTKVQELLSNYLTEQQLNIMRIVESLLPSSTRVEFIDRFSSCVKEKGFLQCTRDITWPTIAQSYPWLPSFPNFGTHQNMPRFSFQVILAEKPAASDSEGQAPQDSARQQLNGVVLRQTEQRIENILARTLGELNKKVERSHLDTGNLDLSHLTKEQSYIVKLVENKLPESERPVYITRILECTKVNYFVPCMQTVSWPTLNQFVPSLPNFPDINDWLSQGGNIQISPEIPQLPGGLPQIPQLPDGLPQIPQLQAELPQVSAFPELRGYLERIFSPAYSQSLQGYITLQRTLPTTPSVDNEGAVPGYAGQPPGILIDISKEKVQLPEELQRQGNTPNPRPSLEANSRKRRSIDPSDAYYETDEGINSSSPSSESFPNITESRYLQLLIKIKQSVRAVSGTPSQKVYFVDALNSTVRGNLTADQYEILKVLEDLDQDSSTRGIAQQVVQCIQSLSFIRCMGIFIWPLISNNLPSLLPSLPSLPSFPSLPGFFGRSIEMENKIQEYFGMSANDFENELLTRKESIEQSFLDWYKKLVKDEFQTNLGFLKIKGYGNGELGFSFSGVREGRGAKLKDNKNLPSILTIISDIMEEVLDQRPEAEKSKKEKKERSIDATRESDIQFLKDSEEYVDIKRSMNDDEIITMFLEKIKSNDSEVADDKAKYFGLEDAYNAFGVLFGTRLPGRLVHQLQNFDDQLKSLKESTPEAKKKVDIVSLESKGKPDEAKVLSLKSEVTYDLEKESSTEQEEKQRQKRGKLFFKSLFEKPEKLQKDYDAKEFKGISDNKIIDEHRQKIKKSDLIIKLPCLDDKVTLKKMTGTLLHIGRSMKTKMMQMMPGVGLVVSFLIQMALAHARAAASMAGMLSNMAIGSAIIGMIRDTFFGSNQHPQVKYVYDNDKVGSGISWPAYGSSPDHNRRQ